MRPAAADDMNVHSLTRHALDGRARNRGIFNHARSNARKRGRRAGSDPASKDQREVEVEAKCRKKVKGKSDKTAIAVTIYRPTLLE